MSEIDEALKALEYLHDRALEGVSWAQNVHDASYTIRAALEQQRVPEPITLDEAANQICRNLVGKDNEIALIMEDGSAYVELMEGYKRIPLPDSADKSLWEQLQDAIAEVTPSPENEDA